MTNTWCNGLISTKTQYVVFFCVPQCHWPWQMLHSLRRHWGKIFISDYLVTEQQTSATCHSVVGFFMCLCLPGLCNYYSLLLCWRYPQVIVHFFKLTLPIPPPHTHTFTLHPLTRTRGERHGQDISACNELRHLIVWCCLSARLSSKMITSNLFA